MCVCVCVWCNGYHFKETDSISQVKILDEAFCISLYVALLEKA